MGYTGQPGVNLFQNQNGSYLLTIQYHEDENGSTKWVDIPVISDKWYQVRIFTILDGYQVVQKFE